ncbi:uncharacterized protein F5891DRAFT_984189 [Suillus fuscotomentosus]|uniref:Uncharacterized protein n=1 Tax=Suillus fuscotomentosus TaxID=1912939 RepID=A0AAD4DWR9_9AGAM|nr:uncharacterized protein F5891DRAFT_984189 [Suillus fuscotomentosus]KAG1895583.1 hypothetical protein F5891DRAFT_984189 [Suillus fuscotomentosus]
MLTFTLELSISFLESLCQVCVLASGCVTMFYISVVPSRLNLALVLWSLCVKYVYWRLGVSLCFILVLYLASVWRCDLASGVAFSAWKSLCIIFVFVLWGTFMRCMPLATVSHSIDIVAI